MFLFVYLLVVPAIFAIAYGIIVVHRERIAVKVRTPFSPDHIQDLRQTVSDIMATLRDNSELNIDLVDEFLSYGLTSDQIHIDSNRYSCLFRNGQEAPTD